MNTLNNTQDQETKAKIQNALIELLHNKEMREISISEICLLAEINRSTFYALYTDLADLTGAIIKQTESELRILGEQAKQTSGSSTDFCWIFNHIEKNRDYFSAYFKLCKWDQYRTNSEYDSSDPQRYYYEFFKSGVHAVAEQWLLNGCEETAERMSNIITTEYIRLFGTEVPKVDLN